MPTIKRERELYAYRVYVTDALQMIAENTAPQAAKYTGGKAGRYLAKRWADLDKPAPPEETRTPEEVIEHMKAKLKGGGVK